MEQNERREQAIVWLLNFLDRDISRLRQPGRMKIFHGLLKSLSAGTQYGFPVGLEWMTSEGLKKIQDSLKHFFESSLFPVLKLFAYRERAASTAQELERVSMDYILQEQDQTKDIRYAINRASMDHPELFAAADDFQRLKNTAVLKRAVSFRKRSFFIENGLFHFKSELDGPAEDVAIEGIISLLASQPPLPLTAFQKCEGCSVWFSGKRKRRFHSPACNRRDVARKAQGEPGSAQRDTYNMEKSRGMKRYRENQKSVKTNL